MQRFIYLENHIYIRPTSGQTCNSSGGVQISNIVEDDSSLKTLELNQCSELEISYHEIAETCSGEVHRHHYKKGCSKAGLSGSMFKAKLRLG